MRKYVQSLDLHLYQQIKNEQLPLLNLFIIQCPKINHEYTCNLTGNSSFSEKNDRNISLISQSFINDEYLYISQKKEKKYYNLNCNTSSISKNNKSKNN